MRFRIVGMTLPMAAAASLLLTACSTSPESLESAVEDKPGVITVEATEHEGDDAIPFQTIAKRIDVVMEADASESQIMAVIDAYDDDIDDGDVYAIAVVLEGPKGAALATGTDIHATAAMVDELVRMQHDDDILEYRREAHPVLPTVHLALASGDFDDVVAVADAYRDADDIDSVTVRSGDYLLIRDEVNEDPEFTAARERFVLEVALQFRLRGAVVSGRGPLRLGVAPSDQAAVRRLVERSTDADALGRVRIITNVDLPS
jgi:hypothetical protein